MAHRQDPMGEVRALEGSRAPDCRAQLIARFASNLEPDESEALVFELLRQHGVQLLERVDDLPHQDVKALVLGLVQRSQTRSLGSSSLDQRSYSPADTRCCEW